MPSGVHDCGVCLSGCSAHDAGYVALTVISSSVRCSRTC